MIHWPFPVPSLPEPARQDPSVGGSGGRVGAGGTTTYPVERIAGMVGFSSPITFRQRFRRHIGTSPNTYRRAFVGT